MSTLADLALALVVLVPVIVTALARRPAPPPELDACETVIDLRDGHRG